MENREKVVADYLMLRIFLNTANLKRNEKTEIEFRILAGPKKVLRLIATLRGGSYNSNLEICTKNENLLWKAAGYSNFYYLEDYCAGFLNSKWEIQFSTAEYRQLVAALDKDLRSLGIPQ